MSELEGQTIDFSMLLASAAHDMKNSLSILLSTLDRIDEVSHSANGEIKGY